MEIEKMATRTFPLRVVLTVTTGRLLTEGKGARDNGISDLYEILGHMTSDEPFTHQLGRFAQECKPWLYRWFPELGRYEAGLPNLDRWISKAPTCPEEGVKMWLTEMKTMFPELPQEYEIGQIPRDDHDVKNPFDELVIMRGTDDGIVVVDGR